MKLQEVIVSRRLPAGNPSLALQAGSQFRIAHHGSRPPIDRFPSAASRAHWPPRRWLQCPRIGSRASQELEELAWCPRTRGTPASLLRWAACWKRAARLPLCLRAAEVRLQAVLRTIPPNSPASRQPKTHPCTTTMVTFSTRPCCLTAHPRPRRTAVDLFAARENHGAAARYGATRRLFPQLCQERVPRNTGCTHRAAVAPTPAPPGLAASDQDTYRSHDRQGTRPTPSWQGRTAGLGGPHVTFRQLSRAFSYVL